MMSVHEAASLFKALHHTGAMKIGLMPCRLQLNAVPLLLVMLCSAGLVPSVSAQQTVEAPSPPDATIPLPNFTPTPVSLPDPAAPAPAIGAVITLPEVDLPPLPAALAPFGFPPFPSAANLPRFPPPPGTPAAIEDDVVSTDILAPGAAPPQRQNVSINVTAALENNGEYSTLLALLQAYDIASAIDSSSTPLTLLAPNNAAFDELSSDVLNELNATGRFPLVLRYHVLVGYYNYTTLIDMANGTRIMTLAGVALPINVGDGRVVVGTEEPAFQVAVAGVNTASIGSSGQPAIVEQQDVLKNGTFAVEGIDRVLLPPGTLGLAVPVAAPALAPGPTVEAAAGEMASPPPPAGISSGAPSRTSSTAGSLALLVASLLALATL